jgi:hypothetical protein
MSRMVVKPHRPGRGPVLAVLVALVVGSVGWGLYRYGRYRAGYDFTALQTDNARLHQSRKALEKTNGALREQKAVLERTSQVEREAHKQLDQTVSGLQDEILELKSELAFYRGIVAPKDASRGLRIQSFDVTPNAVERSYRYKLVLTQVLKNDTVVQGSIGLEIEGSLNGKMKTLDFKQVSLGDAKELKFRFKYFQNFEGDIVLPEGFVPSRVTVSVDPRGRRRSDMEKVFDWPTEES